MADKPIVFMFSGQGSQYFHMGKELFEKQEGFKQYMLEQEPLVKNVTGLPMLDILFDPAKGLNEPFVDSLQTSMAIIMVEIALTRMLMDDGIQPDYLLGASLGEITASILAGIVDHRKTLENIVKRLDIFADRCCKGKMIGIIDHPDLFDSKAELRDYCEIAAINFDSHFVVSCRDEHVARVEESLKRDKVVFQILPVQFAYHSSLLDSAEHEVKQLIEQEVYQPPSIPYISCVNAGKMGSIPQYYYWDVYRKPIRFQEAIQELENHGDFDYVDLGPSGTLANFVSYNLEKTSQSQVFTLLTPFGFDAKNLEKIQHHFSAKKQKDKTMITYVFPGQGSQYKGMGESLFDEFRELTEKADRILGYSIKELCLEDPNKVLSQTQFTQPALYVCNAFAYLNKIKETGIKPDFVAGHSLGEYNALFAAGAVDFETGLILVKKRGELMARASGGAMAAVLGLDENIVGRVLRDNGLTNIDIANYNAPTQIVISGLREDIKSAQTVFEEAGANYVQLAVSAAFHSRHMQQAGKEFETFLQDFRFADLTTPVISNVHARPYRQSEIISNLADQLRSSVKWTESIRYLMGKGEMQFEEIGFSQVLTKLIAKIQAETTPLVVEAEAASQSSDVAVGADEPNPPLIQAGEDKSLKPRVGQTINSIFPQNLGCPEFKADYNLKYAYVTGGMVRGIASKEMVVRTGKAGMLGYFGTGALQLNAIEEAIRYIQDNLKNGEPYGMNMMVTPIESETIDLYLKYGVKNIEASAYLQVSLPLVKYRLKGLSVNHKGQVVATNRIMAKLSRPEVAQGFLIPAPQHLVEELLSNGDITQEEAEWSQRVPMADDICVEADSGGHTDQGVAYALLPAIMGKRDHVMKKFNYSKKIRVGAAGGIGVPQAAAAAFVLGADFILTGSINQCTVEAGISEVAKDLLQEVSIQDTDYAPAGDMFEIGAKVQVLKKGVLFPARANKLYDIYRRYDSLEEIDEKTRKQLEEKIFNRSFEDIYQDVKVFHPPEVIEQAERTPKQKMALIFRWYCGYANHLALNGESEQKIDFQINCGPAMGAFNQWIAGTELQDWRKRHVDVIGERLMKGTAEVLNQRFQSFLGLGN